MGSGGRGAPPPICCRLGGPPRDSSTAAVLHINVQGQHSRSDFAHIFRCCYLILQVSIQCFLKAIQGLLTFGSGKEVRDVSRVALSHSVSEVLQNLAPMTEETLLTANRVTLLHTQPLVDHQTSLLICRIQVLMVSAAALEQQPKIVVWMHKGAALPLGLPRRYVLYGV